MKSAAFLGLGSRHWNIRATLNALPKAYAVQVFDDAPNLFGDPRENLNKMYLEDPNAMKVLAVQLSYTKNSHALVSLDWMHERLPIWQAWKENHPGVDVYISHTTEHYEKNKNKLITRMNLIEDYGLLAVNNPDPGRGLLLPGETNETHKARKLAGRYLASMDGFDTLVKGNVLAWVREHKNSLYDFGWSGLCNLNNGKKGSDINTPCNKRTAAPGREHMQMLFFISECPPVRPVTKAKNFPPKWLWKPVRETTYNKDGSPDCRNDKPCLISKIENKAGFKIFTKDGGLVGKLPYYGPYYNSTDSSKNGFRYYAGSPGGCDLSGYQMAEKAIMMSGSPWVFISPNNGNTIWAVHPAFRFGYFS